MTDSYTREICRDTHILKYVIEFKDGVPVNYVFWYEDDAELINEMFYSENSRWVFGDFQPLWNLH